MQTFKLMIFGMLMVSLNSQAQKAVLIEDNGQDVQSSTAKTHRQSTEESILFGRSRLEPVRQQSSYQNAAEMRSHRRVGAGGLFAGSAGLLGVQAELNYSALDSAVVGIGGGARFSTLGFQWKHVFGGSNISPYSSLGYSRWTSTAKDGSSFGTSNPSYLSAKMLTDSEKQSGDFSLDMLTAGAGLQYNFLSGEYAGTAVFIEVVWLARTSSFAGTQTGSVGALFYF